MPTTISAFPPAPSRDDPANFATEANDYLAHLESPFVAEMNSVISELNTLSSSVTTVANNAISVSNTALASANYRGNWSSLTGAIAKPATVSHGGLFWLLVNNLTDVTASTPALGNADWQNLNVDREYSRLTLYNTPPVIDWDMSLASVALLHLNTDKNFNNPTNIKMSTYLLFVKNDATTPRTIHYWGSAFLWPGGVPPVFGGTNAWTLISLIGDGTNLFGSYTPYG